MKKPIIATLLFFLSFPILAQQQPEVIKSYISELRIQIDRSLIVTENITVHAEGINISRGIFRDIPVLQLTKSNRKYRVDLEVLSVKKNGVDEPYHTERYSNSVRIYIGDADIYLDPGDYEYSISFKIEDQVNFFEGFDEIYYDVVGEYWMFDILEAKATVILPDGANVLQYAAYSGGYGDQGCNCKSYLQDSSTWVVAMNEKLVPGEAFTVSVGFDKGVVQPPTLDEEARLNQQANKILYIGLAGFIAVGLYYFLIWLYIGRDPRKGIIVPEYNVPAGLSPAACRTLLNMSYDKKGFTSTLVNMAVNGAIIIDKEERPWYLGGDKYTLIKTDNPVEMTDNEKEIVTSLFPSSNKYELSQTNYYKLQKGIEKHEKLLREEFDKAYYKMNKGWIAPGIIMSIATIVLVIVFTAGYDDNTLLGLIITFFASIFLLVLFLPLYNAYKKATGVKKNFLLLILLGAGIFVGYQVVDLSSFHLEGEYIDTTILAGFPILILFLIISSILFHYLVKAPSVMGRRLMDKIEGLQMYLATTEEERLKQNLRYDLSIQHFEEMLPYAMALDVEKNWSDRFSSILENAINNGSYSHTWYRTSGPIHFNSFGNDFSKSFASSVSSNSSPPSSSGSSGSSGGGFSGGGSGGGGGGGW